jgi:uncharacterized protein (TIGR02145 family)
VEDSTSTFSATVQNLHGSRVTVKFIPTDTSLISAATWMLTPDGNGRISFPLQAKKDANGGPVFSVLKFSDSLVFDVPPSISILSRNASTTEGYAATDTANLYWNGANTSGLNVTWTVSDSLLLPSANIVFPSTGDSRSFRMQPTAGKWGSVKVRFTVRDSLGGTGIDSLTLVVQPVNHAPSFSLRTRSAQATTWKGDPSIPLLSGISWDDATSGQSGRFELSWLKPADSAQFLSSLRIDSAGVLHLSASIDTVALLKFRVRAFDNGGTSRGGIDSSAWSDTVSLQLVDTVLDADGNSYRTRRMPDGKVWMRSNLYTKPRNGDTAYVCAGASLWDSTGGHLTADCQKRGALYNWGTAMGQALDCDTSTTCWQNIPSPAQGLCPTRWHLAERSEWSGLLVATASAPSSPGASVDSTSNLRSATSDWASNYSGWSEFPGTERYGSFLVPSDHPHHCSDRGAGSINGVNFWLPHRPATFSTPVPGGISFVVGMQDVSSDGMCGLADPGMCSLRCVLNQP